MPVGFDPSRINPRIIKKSLGDRRLVFSGEKRRLNIDTWTIWQPKDILKGERFNSRNETDLKVFYEPNGAFVRNVLEAYGKVFHLLTHIIPKVYTVVSAQ